MQIAITNRGSNQIQPEIIKQMNNAQRSIWIAVAWFTDREIYNVLIEKLKQGVKIRLIALYDDINQEKGVDFDTLSKNGAEVYLTQDGNLLMHHKYCIIDSQTVIMGSYNYTKAAQSHRESVIVSKHENQIVTEFEADFNDILKEYFNKTSNDCPLTMEWWDGLLQYGNLSNGYLKEYNWQHIFMVHLAFLEKRIILYDNVIHLNKQYKTENCFVIYKQEFKIPFATTLPKITQQQLNKIYEINSLWLYSCQIYTLAPLQELKNLQKLVCSYNQYSATERGLSLEPLRELKNLQELNCDNNQISSLEPLRELKNLKDLDCSCNKISSLEYLRELKNFQKLNCADNKISNLEGLQGCENLQDLECMFNEIKSLEPLQELINLQKLRCGITRISNLKPLQKLKNLQVLDCCYNEIISLEPLQELKKMKNLDFRANKIINLDPLRELKNLERLWCAENQISSLEPLRELKNLQDLYCDDNKNSSSELLQELKNLREGNSENRQERNNFKRSSFKRNSNDDDDDRYTNSELDDMYRDAMGYDSYTNFDSDVDY